MKKKRILVVDDSKTNIANILNLLDGYELVVEPSEKSPV